MNKQDLIAAVCATYILPVMPKAKPEEEKKVTVSARISPSNLAALEAMADRMDFKPSISQLIDRAVEEYVSRHGKKDRK